MVDRLFSVESRQRPNFLRGRLYVQYIRKSADVVLGTYFRRAAGSTVQWKGDPLQSGVWIVGTYLSYICTLYI